MTSFRIERFDFTSDALRAWSNRDERHRNWPVVYSLTSRESSTSGEIYVGESLSAVGRLEQHLKSDKNRLEAARVIVADEFNKSACLDLESQLIRLFAGDGKFQVLNGNDGIVDADYFDRARYQATFDAIFEQLLDQGLFTQDRDTIENSDLFKLSPFKALTPDQTSAVATILDGLFADLEAGGLSTAVVRGDPGTGKTVVAVFLMKLLCDIQNSDPTDVVERDTNFADFFVPGHAELLEGFRIGLVVPQQSLRKSVQQVFKRTPGLSPDMVLTAFEVGESDEFFDLLVVDEAHRLNRRSNQASGVQNQKFADITTRLFGTDDLTKTQLDWIVARSRHQVFLVDPAQSVRPGDIPRSQLEHVIDVARSRDRFVSLWSQLRVRGGNDYITWVDDALAGVRPEPLASPDYDLRMFTDLQAMRDEIMRRESEVGLSRLLAGYAWDWKTKKDKTAYDIELDGLALRWNQTQTDWVNSPGSIDEVGSIHTIQGYDLNYAGVIIGKDLRFDPASRHIVFDRSNYFDTKGMENNPKLGIVYTDDDILEYVKNIYRVLLTRGIRGTYVYVCDPALREYMTPMFDVVV